jgi:Family of unknown function (DUF6346)
MPMTDNKRSAERRRRMAELLSQAEEDVARTRAARRASTEVGPVAEVKRGGLLNKVLGVVILLALSAVLAGVAMTIARYTGPDIGDAVRRGTATVEQCERRGPVSFDGFGYFHQCTVKIAWNTGPASRVVIDKPGFFTNERPGDTFEIGQNTGSRGRVGYSRAELPDRGWVTSISAVLLFFAVLPLLAVVVYLREGVKDMVRRRR